MTLKRITLPAVLLLIAFAATAQSYNNIEFVENKGQWDTRVKFKGDVSDGAFFIRSTGFTVLQNDPEGFNKLRDMIHGHTDAGGRVARSTSFIMKSHAYAVDFVGASPAMEITPDKPVDYYNNYLLGNDPSKWAGNCKIYQGITLKNVYDNVDVRYYTNNGLLKYDIIAKPGADISKIALRYDGVDKLQIKDKQLVVSTSIGELRESVPYSYKADGKQRTDVACKYILKNNIVTFDVKNYDPTATLVIDPTLIFCSFANSVADNWGFTATYGPDGSTFGGGIVFNTGFPVSPGAFQTVFAGGSATPPSGAGIDIGIIKLSPSGSNKLFATYIGGSGNELPQSLIADNQGNLIIAGRTNSPDYPVTGGAAGLIGTGGDWDIMVTKLNATGTGLIGSKRIGGSGMDGGNITSGSDGVNSLNRNYGDEARSEVTLDENNNIYLASCTQSGNFPVTAGCFQSTFGGGLQDGVVIKFDANVSNRLFSSYLGGSGDDAAYVISLDPAGNIYVGGGTSSANFPGSHAGTLGTALSVNGNANIDGFVAEVKNDGSGPIIRSTYIGTGGYDQIYGLKFDKNGFPYVMGQTTGAWPIVNATYSVPNAKQFIAKLQPDLSAYVYSTVFGTNSVLPNISPVAFLVDRCENVYVSGWGGAIFGTDPSFYPSAGPQGMPVTPNAIKATCPDNADFYFFVLKKDAASQLYGSFFGQNGGFCDHVDGGTSRFDQNGVIYEAICANCGGMVQFPTTPTPGAYATTKPANALCNLAMVKIAFNLAGVGGDVQSEIGGVPNDTAGCLPLDVTFTDLVRVAESYEWNFGDGTSVGPLPAATGYTQQHTYTAVGTYHVLLVAIDPNSCNIRDTSFLNIRVGDLKANLAASFIKLPPCEGFVYQFDNTASNTDISRPFTDTSFAWDFGDGSPRVVTGLTNTLQHTYPGPGTYNGWLILKDTAYCNNPDSIPVTVSVAANVKAGFTTPANGCAPYNAVFTNTSVGGISYQWDFGDGGTSMSMSPEHFYALPGLYHVTLIVTNDNTCNKTDQTSFDVRVYDKPVASFSYTPVAPVINTPNTFENLSSPDAVVFHWDFGDGDTLRTTSRLPVQHQYNTTGTFNVCLTAYNAVGCDSTVCQPVRSEITPLVDVPKAFTPQSGDINSVVMVRGFGIAKMRFTIWNRWGQKVFETENRLQGWNGRVKGAIQPMDVYAYTLDVEFFDGTKTTKKGDLTLIR